MFNFNHVLVYFVFSVKLLKYLFNLEYSTLAEIFLEVPSSYSFLILKVFQISTCWSIEETTVDASIIAGENFLSPRFHPSRVVNMHGIWRVSPHLLRHHFPRKLYIRLDDKNIQMIPRREKNSRRGWSREPFKHAHSLCDFSNRFLFIFNSFVDRMYKIRACVKCILWKYTKHLQKCAVSYYFYKNVFIVQVGQKSTKVIYAFLRSLNFTLINIFRINFILDGNLFIRGK